MVKRASDVQSIVIWFDGVHKDEYSGIGYTLRARGTPVVSGYEIAPWCSTSMQTEAYALFKALQEVQKFTEVKSVYVYGDAKNVIDALNGNAEFEDGYTQSLIEQAKIMLNMFPVGRASFKPREKNQTAHHLAGKSGRLLQSQNNKQYDTHLP